MAATNIWDKKTPQRKAVQASHQTAIPHRANGKLREEAGKGTDSTSKRDVSHPSWEGPASLFDRELPSASTPSTS